MTLPALLGPALLAVTAQTPEPSPTPTIPPEMTIYNVTPGISGFIMFFVLALVGWLLFRSLVKHMRRVDQARVRQEREVAEETAARGAAEDTAARGAAEPEDGSAGR